MGLLGLRKFIDSTGCTRLLPVPLSEEEALAQAEKQREEEEEQQLRRRSTKPGYGGGRAYHCDDEGKDSDNSDEDDDDDDDGPSSGMNGIVAFNVGVGAGPQLSTSNATAATPAATPAADPSAGVPLVDHVLVDMNCIVHSCFGKHDVTTKSKKELIQLVLERLRVLLTQVVVPRRSLSICLDGPAPYAKLQTQRVRRRKVALMDSSAQQLTSLAITAGSLFLVELENAIAAQFKLHKGKGLLRRLCPVYLFGSTVMGEGESKISRALAFLAATAPLQLPPAMAAAAAASPSSSSWSAYGKGKQNSTKSKSKSKSKSNSAPQLLSRLPQFTNLAPAYNPNDTVTVLGNDIDLVLTCLGATPYHNISIVGPSALQLINVGDIMYRWLRATTTASGGGGGESFKITPEMLPSMRVDFIFLFLLNGGDHYTGAGEVAMPLWRRYRTVRASYPGSSLVSRQLDILDTDFLADVLDASSYSGDADAKPGLSLLQSAMWSLYTTVTGICPDYAYVPEPATPFLQNLRAAAQLLKKRGRQLKLHFNVQSKPLAPLEAYVALMPTEATLPPSVATALRQPLRYEEAQAQGRKFTNQQVARLLATSNDPAEIAAAACEAVVAAQPFLSVSERYLCQFTPPVQLNVIPPKQRLSRYEQQRMLAAKGAVASEDPIPMVRRLDITLSGSGFDNSAAAATSARPATAPAAVPGGEVAAAPAAEYFAPPIAYTNWKYPATTTALTFRSPFGSDNASTADGTGPSAVAKGKTSGGAASGGNSGDDHCRVLLSHVARQLASSAGAKDTRTAEVRLGHAAADLAELKRLQAGGMLESEKRLRAMARRVARLHLEVARCRRAEADEDAGKYTMSGDGASRKRARDGEQPAAGVNADDGDDDDNEAESDGCGGDDDKAFMDDIQKFLGGGSGDAARILTGSATKKHRSSNSYARSGSASSPARAQTNNSNNGSATKKTKNAKQAKKSSSRENTAKAKNAKKANNKSKASKKKK